MAPGVQVFALHDKLFFIHNSYLWNNISCFPGFDVNSTKLHSFALYWFLSPKTARLKWVCMQTINPRLIWTPVNPLTTWLPETGNGNAIQLASHHVWNKWCKTEQNCFHKLCCSVFCPIDCHWGPLLLPFGGQLKSLADEYLTLVVIAQQLNHRS